MRGKGLWQGKLYGLLLKRERYVGRSAAHCFLGWYEVEGVAGGGWAGDTLFEDRRRSSANGKRKSGTGGKLVSMEFVSHSGRIGLAAAGESELRQEGAMGTGQSHEIIRKGEHGGLGVGFASFIKNRRTGRGGATYSRDKGLGGGEAWHIKDY